jgi:outer membrane protein assembly factor BamD (BamD/ComL family)
MRRRAQLALAALLGLSLAIPGGPARAQREAARGRAAAPTAAGLADPTERELRFLRGLRERGYFDLALEYTQRLLAAPDTPADLKAALDYEVGRGLLEQATETADLERRQTLLEQARQKLDEFTKANPNHPVASEALVQLARLNVERGHTGLLQANEIKTEDDQGKPLPSGRVQRETRLAAARAAFAEARKAYDSAEGRLKAAHEAFPRFIPEDDPRREARGRALEALLDCQLQRGIVDYEDAQTHPPGSKPRNDLLDAAIVRFQDLFNRYRTMPAGLYARMLQGKSLEEKGELGPAMGLYNELMEHPEPALRPLQRKVGYFRIIVIGKRKEHALAVDEAARWLNANPNQRTTEEGLGVQLELARNILAQLEDLPEESRDQAVRTAVERLTEVVRYYSPHKAEALALLRQYQPRVARRANQIPNLTYDDAMTQADNAISAHDWSLAEALLKQAIRRAERTREIDKVNRARYFLAYVYYASGHYYEAVALADHLARRYPQGGLSAKSAEIGIAALTEAYNTFTRFDRASDLDRLVAFCEYAAATWPDDDEGDAARLLLGDIAMGRGQYADAARWLEQVREASPKRLDAQVKAGDAHWRLAQRLRAEDKATEAEVEAKTALDRVAGALQARDAAGAAPTDPSRIANVNALAEIHRASGRPAEAIALIEPIAQALRGGSPSEEVVPLYAASLSILLRSQLAAGQADRAIATMKTLEAVSPSKATLTQLYFELGRSLQSELDALEKARNQAAYRRTQEAYKQFLQTLANSEAGQSYDSLQWAGESMLNLKMPAEAAAVFRRVLDTFGKDAEFQKQPDAANRLLRTRLKLAAALRGQRQFDEARKLVQTLADENPRLLDPLLEKGYLIEEEARAASGSDAARLWEQSLAYWKDLGGRLRAIPQRRAESFEAWYHVAIALRGLGRKDEAISTLKGVLTLTPSVGGPEMKAKYEELLKQLSGS